MTIQKKLVSAGCTLAKLDLLFTFDRGAFTPNFYETYTEWFPSQVFVEFEEQIVEFRTFNACHRKEYDRIRPAKYQNSDVILACFAIDRFETLEYIETTFRREVQKYGQDAPIIMVGLKSDLRNENRKLKRELVRVEEARRVAGKIGAVVYIECSAKTKHNVEEVFVAAANVAFQEKPKNNAKVKKSFFWQCSQ